MTGRNSFPQKNGIDHHIIYLNITKYFSLAMGGTKLAIVFDIRGLTWNRTELPLTIFTRDCGQKVMLRNKLTYLLWACRHAQNPLTASKGKQSQ